MQAPAEQRPQPVPEEVLGRLQEVYGAKSDAALARALDTSASTVTGWRTRGVPYAICVDAAIQKGHSLDWLLFGIKAAAMPSAVAERKESLAVSTEQQRDPNWVVKSYALVDQALAASGLQASDRLVDVLRTLTVMEGLSFHGLMLLARLLRDEELARMRSKNADSMEPNRGASSP